MINTLRTHEDPVANQRLIYLAYIKAQFLQRSENKELWNV